MIMAVADLRNSKLQQQLGNLCMPISRGFDVCGPSPLVSNVHLHVRCSEQEPDHLLVSVYRGCSERCLVIVVGHVDLDAWCLKQEPDYLCEAIRRP